MFPGPWPAFTSNIRVELYKDTAQTSFFKSPKHYVRLLYQGEPMKVPACAAAADHHPSSNGELCTAEAFSKALQRYAIGRDEWRSECLRPIDSTDAPRDKVAPRDAAKDAVV
jgi:acid phosphatase